MRRPIQLILVDLDNLRHDQVGPLPEPSQGPFESDTWFDSSGSPPPLDASKAPCVVVFAMNLDTASDQHLDFGPLQRFGERLACVIARAPLAGLEIALTLPVKQSADKALERLFGSAPRVEHAGSLESVYVLSGDQGLQDSIGAKLSVEKYQATKLGDGFTRAWVLGGKKRGAQRQAPKDPRLGLVVASSAPSDRTQAIDTPDLAAWANAQPIDLEPGLTLPQLVDLVRRRPGLLTQVGLTLTSLRGLVRMDAVARGEHPRLGPCAVGEGLELCREEVRRGHYQKPAESSLGPGAIRLGHPQPITARTLLPPHVAMAVKELEVGSLAAVVDTRALENASLPRLSSSPPFKVRLYCRSRALFAEVTSPFGQPLPAWWLRKSKTWSTRTVRSLATALPNSITIHAISDVIVDGGDRIVVARAPFTGGVTVELGTPLRPDGLGAGTVGDHHVAVLGREDRLERSLTLRCQPIQELSDTALRSAYPSLQRDFADLKQLPLMVPT